MNWLYIFITLKYLWFHFPEINCELILWFLLHFRKTSIFRIFKIKVRWRKCNIPKFLNPTVFKNHPKCRIWVCLLFWIPNGRKSSFYHFVFNFWVFLNSISYGSNNWTLFINIFLSSIYHNCKQFCLYSNSKHRKSLI